MFNLKKITFTAVHFALVGELSFPKGEGPFPIILFVHGDGPATRTACAHEKERMWRAGYATFVWDKPGSGESRGKFEEKQLLHQRARILLAAVEAVKQEPRIDRKKIGVWGISQGGYVMSIARSTSKDISFLIAVSCPGEASVNQISYLLKSVAECGVASQGIADSVKKYVMALNCAKTYKEYVQLSTDFIPYAKYIESFVRKSSGPKPREKWHPAGPEFVFNPMANIEQTTIPILAFSEKGTSRPIPFKGSMRTRKPFSMAAIDCRWW